LYFLIGSPISSIQIQVIILIQVFMNKLKGYPGLGKRSNHILVCGLFTWYLWQGDHITNKTRIANNFRHFAKQILATEDKEIIVNFLKIAFENDEISSNRTSLMNQFDKVRLNKYILLYLRLLTYLP